MGKLVELSRRVIAMRGKELVKVGTLPDRNCIVAVSSDNEVFIFTSDKPINFGNIIQTTINGGPVLFFIFCALKNTLDEL